MAALATERRTYTAAEFLELAADLKLAGSQDWYEVIGGELLLRPGDTLRCPLFPELGVEVVYLFSTP